MDSNPQAYQHWLIFLFFLSESAGIRSGKTQAAQIVSTLLPGVSRKITEVHCWNYSTLFDDCMAMVKTTVAYLVLYGFIPK